MEYHRRGPHQGFWRLKPNWTIPSDADMLKMVTPEQVVLAESMQVGQRHLQDSRYSYNGEVAEDDDATRTSWDCVRWLRASFSNSVKSERMQECTVRGVQCALDIGP